VTPAQLSEALLAAVRAAVADGELSVPVPATVHVERPRHRDHGDYASNVALQLARAAGKPPREVATILAARLRENDAVEEVAVAGPGFLNITLASAAQGELARAIVKADPHTAVPKRWPSNASTSSSSRPTRPDRSTSATLAGLPSATACIASSRRRAPR